MTSEARKMVILAADLVLLAALMVIVLLFANIGNKSADNLAEQQAMRLRQPESIEMTRGTIGYYELIDLIDFYSPIVDVTLKKDAYHVLKFTVASRTENTSDSTVKLVVTTPTEEVEYRRGGGVLYRDGLATTNYQLETDFGLSPNSLEGLNNLSGSGMLGYEFTQALLSWAIDERFICTVEQTYDTATIDSITIEIL